MLTRCPNPRCKHTFDVPDDRQGKNGPCPSCGQVITFRSLDIILEVERQHAKAAAAKSAPAGETGLPRFSAVLEDIRSLWNVGSIFRTADGAGFGRLYLCGITGTPPHKSIAKTSLGAEDFVPWEHHSHVLDFLPKLVQDGIQLVALEHTETSVDLAQALRDKLLRPPLCLIVGNEVAGVSAEALALSKVTCHLPMHGVKSSLNVAVAFGIGAYQIAHGT
jgi:tRNA G18 (ribose-2'-O)-methylase SpoU